MDYWPSYIAGPSSISGGVDDPYIEAQADTGDDAARARFSAARMTPFKLSWNAMMLAEYRYLVDQFYPAHRAITFWWRHPSQGQTYEVRFVSSPISTSEEGNAPYVARVEVELQPLALAANEQADPSIDDLMATVNEGADRAVDAAFSAAESRDSASASAATASTDATRAETAVASIGNSVETAAASAAAAQASAATADMQAASALDSASAAAVSADDAASSAEAAATSAISATADAQAAASSASTASTAAETAGTAEQGASASAATASTDAARAETAVASIGSSVETAAAFATTAQTSAATADTQAVRAQESANAAAVSAGNASSSAESAASSAISATADAQAAASSAVSAASSAGTATAMLTQYSALSAQAATLTPGSEATAAFSPETGVLALGIPRGLQGPQGEKGEKGDGVANWGDIGGTLSAQTDLAAALANKLSLSGGTLTDLLTIGTASTTVFTGVHTVRKVSVGVRKAGFFVNADGTSKFLNADVSKDKASIVFNEAGITFVVGQYDTGDKYTVYHSGNLTLSSDVDSASETNVATSKAVKDAYDRGSAGVTAAQAAADSVAALVASISALQARVAALEALNIVVTP